MGLKNSQKKFKKGIFKFYYVPDKIREVWYLKNR